eukprot:TRINITY_DN13589_c0_g2_i1.p1 TRINITY_DN13589_c0_g2~~TRINITY_DN13589_c0_g2_i1.p1  ORF type:complete len:155 (+),score=11.33 TRINITY_DN13589_c0_g2_i1:173-637(+)
MMAEMSFVSQSRGTSQDSGNSIIDAFEAFQFSNNDTLMSRLDIQMEQGPNLEIDPFEDLERSEMIHESVANETIPHENIAHENSKITCRRRRKRLKNKKNLIRIAVVWAPIDRKVRFYRGVGILKLEYLIRGIFPRRRKLLLFRKKRISFLDER